MHAHLERNSHSPRKFFLNSYYFDLAPRGKALGESAGSSSGQVIASLFRVLYFAKGRERFMHNMLYLIKPGLVLICCIAFSFLIALVIRGSWIPQCFQCGAAKVRPSQRNGFWDLAGGMFLIRSYRCTGCLARFHAVRLFHRRPRPS